MRKIIFYILFAFIFVLPLAAQAGLPEAVSYLKTQTLDDWTAQALVAAGQTVVPTPLKTFSGSSVTDYAKRIMALVAAGQNPTSYTGADLVAGLKSFANAGQLGDTFLLNDDAWGIMALRAAGVPNTDATVQASANYLLANQNSDGGWSWGVGFASDTNDTAAVLMALADVGYTIADQVVAKGVAYLTAQQNLDAGWPYQLPCFWPNCEASDSASTAWVIAALNKLNLHASNWTKSGQSPQDFLLTLQTGDGSFKWQAGDPAGSQAMTAYAVVALADQSYPVKRGNYLGGHGYGPTPLADLEIIWLGDSGMKMNEGEQIGLVAKLVNKGPNMAQGVVAKLTLPEGVTLIDARSSDGEFDSESKQWTFIRLNNYAEAQLQLVVEGSTALVDAIKISVSAQELDFNLTNNESVIQLTVAALEPTADEVPRPEVLGEAAYSCEPTVTAEDVSNWRGYIIARQNSDTAWYVDPILGEPYCLSDSAAAYRALEKFGLGITNENLSKIPMAEGEPVTVAAGSLDAELAARLKGRILLQVESLGEAWYVNPRDGLRYYLKDGAAALQRLSQWRIIIGQ